MSESHSEKPGTSSEFSTSSSKEATSGKPSTPTASPTVSSTTPVSSTTSPEKEKPKVSEGKSRDGDDVSPKQDLMALVQKLIAGSKIASAKIWNPWTSVIEKGVSIDDIRGTAGLVSPPQYIRDSIGLWSTLDESTRKKYKWLAGTTPLDDNAFEGLRQKQKKEYLKWGADAFRAIVGGNCTYITGATIGLLAANAGKLPKGTVVELFSLEDKSSGHAFAVIGRTEGTLGDPRTWGPGAFVVDPWYGLQRLPKEDGRHQFVKDVTGTSGTFYEAGFVKDFLLGATIVKEVTFSYDDLLKFRA